MITWRICHCGSGRGKWSGDKSLRTRGNNATKLAR
jgi:hypothetical protein